jgi:hypothetical protein
LPLKNKKTNNFRLRKNTYEDQVVPLLIHLLPWLYFYIIKNKVKTLKPKAMKTTKFFSVLSLALIFAGINTSYAFRSLTDIPKEFHTASVSYDVYVHLVADNGICNVYLVQVSDEKGRLVAPVQIYEPGVTKYNFHEQGLIRGKLRIAKLVRATYPEHFVCVNELYTSPAVKEGPFLMGQTYSFDLYPVMTIQKVPDKD